MTDRFAVQKGATKALHPVPVDDDPELKALLTVLDLEEILV